jgi:orotate phosphoribosyltransferase-like protein
MDWDLAARRYEEIGKEAGIELTKKVFKLRNAGISTEDIAKQLNMAENEAQEILE